MQEKTNGTALIDFKQILFKMVEGKSLEETEMVDAMTEIMNGNATPAQIAAFITALRIKGETITEMTGALA